MNSPSFWNNPTPQPGGTHQMHPLHRGMIFNNDSGPENYQGSYGNYQGESPFSLQMNSGYGNPFFTNPLLGNNTYGADAFTAQSPNQWQGEMPQQQEQQPQSPMPTPAAFGTQRGWEDLGYGGIHDPFSQGEGGHQGQGGFEGNGGSFGGLTGGEQDGVGRSMDSAYGNDGLGLARGLGELRGLLGQYGPQVVGGLLGQVPGSLIGRWISSLIGHQDGTDVEVESRDINAALPGNFPADNTPYNTDPYGPFSDFNGGYTGWGDSGEGWGGFSNSEMDSAADQSDAQAAENESQGYSGDF